MEHWTVGHTRKSRTSVCREAEVRTSLLVFRLAEMVLPLLLLVLVNIIGGHVLHNNLINGSFRYKVGQKGFIVLDSRLNFANRKVRMMAL